MNAPFSPSGVVNADAGLRRTVERAVDRLLAFVDTLDTAEGGDEREDDELEPSFDADRDEQEPWLSAPENHPGDCRSNGDQSRWAEEAVGSAVPHAEQDEGDEPSLGWTSAVNQAGAKWLGSAVAKSEREHPVLDGEAGDDTGIGDKFGINFDDEDTNDREGDNADSEWSLGWTIDCSRGETGATWKGEGGDREQNGDEGDYSGTHDDSLWPGSAAREDARQGRKEARAMLATVPEIVPAAPLVIVGPDGRSYQLEPIGKDHRP